MENKELVSVIIPVYNVERYLRECVDSVLAQSYENFEIILVDDGSTDTSGELCDTYQEKDSRILVIHQKNGGLSEARNVGLAKARGKYVYFLDSDDWILPETLELLIEKAEIEGAEVVFFDAKSFEAGDPEKTIRQNYLRKCSYETNAGFEVLKQLQENREYHSAAPLLFIEKALLDNTGLRFEPGILYEDMIFTYALFCQAKRVAYINKAFYQRRYRSNSIMTSKKTAKNYTSMLSVYEHVKRISTDLNLVDDDIARSYIVRCALNVFNNYEQLDYSDKRECKILQQGFKEKIKEEKGHGQNVLYYRCYGKVAWIWYKVITYLKRS